MYIQNSELKLDKGIYAQRKNWNYEAKIVLAKRRIEEWDVHWDGQVYLSFSGGLDSTVLLALIRMTMGKVFRQFSVILAWNSRKSCSLREKQRILASIRSCVRQ